LARALFARAERFLRGDALGDVARDAHEADRAPDRVADRRARLGEPAPAAVVETILAEDVDRRLPLLEHAAFFVVRRPREIRGEHVFAPLAREPFGAGPVHEPGKRPVRPQEPALAILEV